MTVNLYEVLGAKPTDDAATLRRAFIDAARLHHPDRHAEDDEASRAAAEDRMRLVNQAWSVLGDARRRASYDAQLARTAATPTTGRPRGRTTREPSSGVSAPRWMTMLPAAMMAIALSCLILGFLTRLVGLMAFGVLFALAAAAAFVLVPVATMNRSRKRERPA